LERIGAALLDSLEDDAVFDRKGFQFMKLSFMLFIEKF